MQLWLWGQQETWSGCAAGWRWWCWCCWCCCRWLQLLLAGWHGPQRFGWSDDGLYGWWLVLSAQAEVGWRWQRHTEAYQSGACYSGDRTLVWAGEGRPVLSERESLCVCA
eukprot:scaffold143644_cov17-Tisochrysis_lutea.AAC.1